MCVFTVRSDFTKDTGMKAKQNVMIALICVALVFAAGCGDDAVAPEDL